MHIEGMEMFRSKVKGARSVAYISIRFNFLLELHCIIIYKYITLMYSKYDC